MRWSCTAWFTNESTLRCIPTHSNIKKNNLNMELKCEGVYIRSFCSWDFKKNHLLIFFFIDFLENKLFTFKSTSSKLSTETVYYKQCIKLQSSYSLVSLQKAIDSSFLSKTIPILWDCFLSVSIKSTKLFSDCCFQCVKIFI